MPSLRLGRQAWLLLAILCVALYLRLATIAFGLPAMNDPDELMFELGALRMLRTHSLDPGWFGHPATTTMYVLAVIDAAVFGFATLTGRAASARQFGSMVYADPSWIVLPGRIAMVLFALGTIWLTWSLARRFFGPRAGLVAALLLALNPVHITWSQIIRSDMMACLFMLLCLRSCAAIADSGKRRDYAWSALWLGLAIATKWPFALSGLAIAAASIAAAQNGVLSRRTAMARAVGAGIAGLVILLLVSPYLLLDYPTVLKNVQGEGQARHLGATGGSPWYNLSWYLGGPLLTGFGVLGLALVAFGALHLGHRRRAIVVLVPVAGAFLVLFCLQHLVWERWALPLMPLAAMVAAWGYVEFSERLQRSFVAGWVRYVPAALLLATVLPLSARAAADGRARMNDTRQQASAWARGHIPRGSRVLIEHNAFDMLDRPWSFLFPMGNAGCVDVVALIEGRASYATIDLARDGRSNVDYGTMAPQRRAECRADFAILTNYGRYRQERALFPREYAAYRALIATGSVVATFAPAPGTNAGPLVVIVDLRPAGVRTQNERFGVPPRMRSHLR
ncbi:ArnT family glycosyltransferase [Sphingomonas sp. PB4P5]|uniref:ArnT family glycosyltransferase n=1 Tax=Parasphingomonas puruogangriensis TaxID=3096155 RepID=UPI002FC8D471